MNDVTNCNQCHNACMLDEVKCGRGEKYREYILGGGKPEEYETSKGEAHGGGERNRKHSGHGHHGGYDRHGERSEHGYRREDRGDD